MIDLCITPAVTATNSASPDLLGELIQIAPHFLWALVVVCVLRFLGRENILRLLGNISKISVAGFELEIKQQLNAAAAVRGKPVPAAAADRLSRRVADARRVMDGAKILWVDDNPAWIEPESKLLADTGAIVVTATSTEQALGLLPHNRFDLIISDINRNGEKAGLALESEIRKLGTPPLIFYVGSVESDSLSYASGITDRPDELLRLVLDSLISTRG